MTAPTLWRYLIVHFLKVTIACVAAFIAVLLAMRLDEIAHFAALGAPLSYIFAFTLYQIPYILPLAIPLSCFIASFILVQQLSASHELTALRASGFALRDILAPILLTAAFMAILNFWIVSEVATQSHLSTNTLKSELRAINPLLLLNNKHLMRMKGIYFEAFGPSRVGEFANDVILALPDKHHGRLQLVVGEYFSATPETFTGKGLTFISSREASGSGTNEQPEIATVTYDDLLIENIEESITAVQDFAQLLQQKIWTINNDYLKLSLLLTRIDEQRQAIAHEPDPARRKELRAQTGRSISDIFRRLSIAVAVFSFTLMGTAFGMNISRQRKKTGVAIAIGLTTFYLMAFFVAKGLDRSWPLAAALYMIPPFVLIGISSIVLRRINQGIE